MKSDCGRELKHIPALDGIRGLAIFMVMCAHFNGEAILKLHLPQFGPIATKLALTGLMGVDLFFVLSGFLITRILLAAKDQSLYFLNFYWRRVLRIFPLYYMSLFIVFVILPNLITFDGPGIALQKHQWMFWVYLQNFPGNHPGWDASSLVYLGHFWSLAVEEHFYIVWPLVVYACGMEKLKRISLYWAFSSMVYGLVMTMPECCNIVSLPRWSTLSFSGAIALGSYIGISWCEGTRLTRFERNLLALFPFGVLTFLLVSLVPRQLGAWSEFGEYVRHYTSWFVFVGMFLVIFKGKDGTLKGSFDYVLNFQLLRFLGKISYGLYVYHGMLRPFYEAVFNRQQLITLLGPVPGILSYFLLAMGSSILLAWLSWSFIEVRLLRYKTYFQYAVAPASTVPGTSG